MARGKKEDSYEMVLESRHLLGVFFAVVLLCALFFTFGFLLGRSQQPARTAVVPSPAQAPASPVEEAAPTTRDLSFYDRVEGSPMPENLVQERAPATREAGEPPSALLQKEPETATARPASIAKVIYLQVAALTRAQDAKRLSAELENLGFPVVIRPPREDRFYRVQVGPFQDAELADAGQRRLEAHGFRPIIRR